MSANNAEPQSANPIRSPSSQPTGGSVQNSSRLRFGLHRKQVKQNELNKTAYHSSGDVLSAKDRVRSSAHLAWQFLRLLIPYRWQTIWIMVSVTAATLIGLLPPTPQNLFQSDPRSTLLMHSIHAASSSARPNSE
jgi:hypothetical protein